jgi:hypothetical protein
MFLYTFNVSCTALLSPTSLFKLLTIKPSFSLSSSKYSTELNGIFIINWGMGSPQLNWEFPRKRRSMYSTNQDKQAPMEGPHGAGWTCIAALFSNEGNRINSANTLFEKQMSWSPISYHPYKRSWALLLALKEWILDSEGAPCCT